MSSTLMPTYSPLPIELVKGEDVWVWDTNNNKYLDALAGIAVTNVGHAHPEIVRVITEQAEKILHTSNIMTIPQQLELANRLTSITGMTNAFFCSTGAEANECAIKLARLYGNKQNFNNPTIIVTENAFHGRTLATISASGSRKVQAGFEPLVQGFARVPFDDLDAIAAIAQNNSEITAVMVEPIQGESGVRPASDEYLVGLRKICDDNNWLLILDEIQTGVGRTGEWFAYKKYDIKPDIVTSAKGLGNGIPIGACLATNKASELFQVGNHGTTFGGNPLSCATALTVLDIIEKEGLLENATTVGSYLQSCLSESLSGVEGVNEVRGRGLMIGVNLDRPCRPLLNLGAEAGLLFSIAGDDTIRLVPPLTLTKEHADKIVDIITTIIPKFYQQK